LKLKNEHTIFLKTNWNEIRFRRNRSGILPIKLNFVFQKAVYPEIINVSRPLMGKQPDGKPWSIGIVNPLNKNKVFCHIPLEE
jgi:thiamine biosynthesis lipoprotein